MWPFSRRTQSAQYQFTKIYPTPSELLARLPDDAARALQCHEWAVDARAKLFQGQQESVQDMLLSREYRYRHMDDRARTIIGTRKWETSAIAADLLKTEEMYSRWSRGYAAAVRLKDRNLRLKDRSL